METHIFRILAISFALFGCIPALASVPLRWTVETSRAQTAQFDAYHGETLDLAASFQSYGKPLAVNGQASLYYQTNGMDAAWWTAPASVSSNTISATFAPALDPGARVLNCFLGGTSSNYRAAFRLRFAESPGATPNLLPLPTVSYDARLNGTPTINGTNIIEYIVAASGAEVDPTVPAWAKQPNPPQSGTDEADVKRLINAEVGGTNTLTHGGPYMPTNSTTVVGSNFKLKYRTPEIGGWGNGGTANLLWGEGTYWHIDAEATKSASLVNGGTAAIYYDENEDDWHLYTNNRDGIVATTNDLSLYQHALPYPTNAIPGSVVSGYVNHASEAVRLVYDNFSLYVLGGMTMGTWYVHDSRGYSELATYASAGQIATNVYNSMPSTYAATNAVVSLNQSVQYASVAQGQSLTILAPSAVADGIRDWVVYANCATNSALVLPTANYYLADEAVTNELKSGVTVLYFTEIPNAGYHLSRQELKAIAIGQ